MVLTTDDERDPQVVRAVRAQGGRELVVVDEVPLDGTGTSADALRCEIPARIAAVVHARPARRG